MARNAKRKKVDHVRVVVYMSDKSYQQMEALASASNIHRSAVVAIAIARLHRAEVKRGNLAIEESPSAVGV